MYSGYFHRQPDTSMIPMRKSHHLTFSAGEPAGAKRHVIGIATGMSEIDAAIPVARGNGQQLLCKSDRIRVYR